jgi:hypothetical protein
MIIFPRSLPLPRLGGHSADSVPSIPDRTSLDRWRAKMDRMLMFYRRRQWEEGFYNDSYFQLGVDSSPQIGMDYLVVREEVLTVKRYDGWIHNPLSCLSVESRTKPLTTMAWGESDLARKLVRLGHALYLETGSKHYDSYRHRMRHGYSDQGTEKGLWSCPNVLALDTVSGITRQAETGALRLSDAAAREGKMFPNAWESAGHLHMAFNALKKGLEAISIWKLFEGHLRSFGTFLGRRGLRKRFAVKCLSDRPRDFRMFLAWTGGAFSWRWEKLYIFCSN